MKNSTHDDWQSKSDEGGGMIARCRLCGREIELEGEPSDGQHIRCPHCNGKFSYGGTALVCVVCPHCGAEHEIGKKELYRYRKCEACGKGFVAGAATSLLQEDAQGAGAGSQGERAPAQDERVSAPDGGQRVPIPGLHSRRPASADELSPDLNAQAIMRKLNGEVRESPEAADRSAEITAEAIRKARRDANLRFFVIAAFVLACIVAGLVWHAKHRAAQRDAEAAAGGRQEAVGAEKAGREDSGKAQTAEEEAKRRAAEREERMKREAAEREARRAADEEASRKRAAEEEKRRQELEGMKAERTRFRKVEESFRNAVLLPYRSLRREDRPGVADGVFHFAVPRARGAVEFYEVTSGRDGVRKAEMLSPDGGGEELEYARLGDKVKAFGGVIYNGHAAYAVCPVEGGKGIPIPENGYFSPAQMRMGEMHWLIQSMGMSPDRLTFELRVELPGWRKPVYEKSVAYGDGVPVYEIERALRDAAASGVRAPNAKAKRVTVKFYDGDIIKRQSGVTLVPRTPIRGSMQWRKLSDEAEKQEREAASAAYAATEQHRAAVERKFGQYRSAATMSIGVRETER